jgi:DNA replication and repair protein RecF
MYLAHLEADRLRNLKAVSLDVPDGLTVISGKNGQGKSSLLEAVYLLGTGRSFRTRRVEELIAWEGGPLRVAGQLETRAGPTRLTVVLEPGERRLSADGSEVPLERFLGRLRVVDLGNERMRVLRGGPEERRRFLDRGILGLHSGYLLSLGQYRRALQQRNALLRQGARGYSDDAQLEVWDERLASAAYELHKARREYAVLLGPELGEVGRLLFADDRELGVRYRPSPESVADRDAGMFIELFLERLAKNRRKDKALGHTFSGPHRDDLAVEIDGVDLRKYGSAGQLRASMIALKLGKLSLLRKDGGEPPLFLMDDFDSDLDDTRASALAGYLHGGGFQALAATSKEGMAEQLGVGYARVRIEDGIAESA